MSRTDQFFHGTTHNITDGMVRPADDTSHGGVSEYSFGDPGDMSEGDHAFAIRNDEHYAWHAAMTFHRNGRRPRVYETGPAHDMKPGPWNKEHPDFLYHHDLDDPTGDYPPHPDDVKEAQDNHQDEWASQTGFPIKKRIDIMPGHQGTFPTVNWNRFRHSRALYDANHPDDGQVQHGMNHREDHQDELRRNAVPEVPERQPGQTLRDFMMGKPAPKPGEPGHPQGGLF